MYVDYESTYKDAYARGTTRCLSSTLLLSVECCLLLSGKCLGLSETEKTAKSGEFDAVESLREYVGYIVVCINVCHLNLPRLYALAKKMKFDIDVFDALMQGWVFG